MHINYGFNRPIVIFLRRPITCITVVLNICRRTSIGAVMEQIMEHFRAAWSSRWSSMEQLWSTMEQYGALMEQLGAVWSTMEQLGAVWSSYGAAWSTMEHFGAAMEQYGAVWSTWSSYGAAIEHHGFASNSHCRTAVDVMLLLL
jgi:hypothetical protein